MAIQNNFPNIRPTLNLNFALSKRVDPRITFVRATTATYFDQDGVLQSAANNQGRITFDPSTLDCQGLLIEEQRTNSIRNNTMVGAVAGTPGTLPTNWTYFEAGSELVAAVVGTGTENGITYIDIKVSGTVTAARSALIFFDSAAAASASQSWTESLYLKLQAGSTANIEQINIRTDYYNSTPTFISSTVGSALTVTSAALNTQRQSNAVTTPASTASIQPILRVRSNASGAIDITLRIGLPQLELGAFATSVIPTTTTALTRNADVASMTGTNFSSWYNASEGTVYSETELLSGVTSANRFILEFNDGVSTSGDKWDVRRTGGASCRTVVRNNGNTVGDRTQNNANNNLRIAAALNSTALALCTNGAATTEVNLTTPGNITVNQMQIGGGVDLNTLQLNGTIRSIRYYPVRVSDAQLQALTG